jgi:hypothetical protein
MFQILSKERYKYDTLYKYKETLDKTKIKYDISPYSFYDNENNDILKALKALNCVRDNSVVENIINHEEILKTQNNLAECLLCMCISDDSIEKNESKIKIMMKLVEFAVYNAINDKNYKFLQKEPLGSNFCYHYLKRVINDPKFKQFYDSLVDYAVNCEHFDNYNIFMRELLSGFMRVSDKHNDNNTPDIIQKLLNYKHLGKYGSGFISIDYKYDKNKEYYKQQLSKHCEDKFIEYAEMLSKRFDNPSYTEKMLSHPVLRYNKRIVKYLADRSDSPSTKVFDEKCNLMREYFFTNKNDCNYKYIEFLYDLYPESYWCFSEHDIKDCCPKTNEFILKNTRPNLNKFTREKLYEKYAFIGGPFFVPYTNQYIDSDFKTIVLYRNEKTLETALKYGGNPFVRDHNGNNAFEYVYEKQNKETANKKYKIMSDFVANQNAFVKVFMKFRSIL